MTGEIDEKKLSLVGEAEEAIEVLLPDSTVYIDLLRAHQDPVGVLRPWLLHEEIAYCGVIRCEVLREVVLPLTDPVIAEA